MASFPVGRRSAGHQHYGAHQHDTYVRTWQIEYNPVIGSTGQNRVTGTRRITVLVTNTDNSVKPPVTFQMSLVRQ